MRTKYQKTNMSEELIMANYQISQTGILIKKLFYELLNAHIRLKELNPVETIGTIIDYEALKFYGHCSMSERYKIQMFKEEKDKYPDKDHEWMVDHCKLIAYNKYLIDMVNFQMRVSQDGETVDADMPV